jgi:hypothetical protein
MRVEFKARAPNRRQFRGGKAAAAVLVLVGAVLASGRYLTVPFQLTPGPLRFDNVPVGSQSAPQFVTVTNPDGRGKLHIQSVSLAGNNAAVFGLSWSGCESATIEPKSSCMIGVSFHPTAPGTETASLLVSSGPGGQRAVSLIGSAPTSPGVPSPPPPGPIPIPTPTPPVIEAPTPTPAPTPAPIPTPVRVTPKPPPTPPAPAPVTPPPTPPPIERTVIDTIAPAVVQFGAVAVGSGTEQSVIVTSTGNTPVALGQARITGDHWSEFRIVSDTCSNRAVPAHCTLQIAFIPTETGQHNSTVTLSDNTTRGRLTAWLVGTALPPPVPVADLQPVRIALTRLDFEHSLELRNTGSGALKTGKVELGGRNPEDFTVDPRGCANASLPPGQSCTMSVTFRPDIAKKERHKVSEATIIVPDNAAGSPHTALVTGTEGSKSHKQIWYAVAGAAAAAAVGGGIYMATHDHPTTGTHTPGNTTPPVRANPSPPPRATTPPSQTTPPPQNTPPPRTTPPPRPAPPPAGNYPPPQTTTPPPQTTTPPPETTPPQQTTAPPRTTTPPPRTTVPPSRTTPPPPTGNYPPLR